MGNIMCFCILLLLAILGCIAMWFIAKWRKSKDLPYEGMFVGYVIYVSFIMVAAAVIFLF